jgi:DNA helicase-2/ATP-dependent DNA helicase PcrA
VGKNPSNGGSLDNIANFFAARGQKIPSGGGFSHAKPDSSASKSGLNKGARVRHAKYGEGVVMLREGDGEDAKITVQFQKHGVKKLVEKFAQLVAL